MSAPAKYDAFFVNHVELLHRPGERALAVAFFETLGCSVVELTDGFGANRCIMGVFAGPDDQDALNNVLYLSEFREPQHQLDEFLQRAIAGDDDLRTAVESHAAISNRPGDVSHFGLRFPSFEELAVVVNRLQNELPSELAGHVVVYPSSPVALPKLGAEVNQAFVHTDVIGTGLFPFGQLIELQAQRPLHA